MHAGDLGLGGPECQPTFDSRRTAPVSCSTRATHPVRTAYRIPHPCLPGPGRGAAWRLVPLSEGAEPRRLTRPAATHLILPEGSGAKRSLRAIRGSFDLELAEEVLISEHAQNGPERKRVVPPA